MVRHCQLPVMSKPDQDCGCAVDHRVERRQLVGRAAGLGLGQRFLAGVAVFFHALAIGWRDQLVELPVGKAGNALVERRVNARRNVRSFMTGWRPEQRVRI